MIDIKADLEEALTGFKWEVIGLLLEDQRVIDVPSLTHWLIEFSSWSRPKPCTISLEGV